MRGVSRDGAGMTRDDWRRFYRELGFAAVPLVPRGKRPMFRGWLDGQEEQWSRAPADANVGILTGARSGGLVVLDFDTRDGPERVLGMTVEQIAVLTMVVETSRGWHVYVREAGVASGTPREGSTRVTLPNEELGRSTPVPAE